MTVNNPSDSSGVTIGAITGVTAGACVFLLIELISVVASRCRIRVTAGVIAGLTAGALVD